jgi:lysophospholipase L1-like esterase
MRPSRLAGLLSLLAACSAPPSSGGPHPPDADADADGHHGATRAGESPRPSGSHAGGGSEPQGEARKKHEGPLGHFHDALADLADERRSEHVRVAWLGDSHAQADFWPDAIRRGLQNKFGNGGLGFLHVGMNGYRHAGIRFDIQGKWRMRPKMPSTIQPWPGGALGLGGVLNAGFAGNRVVSMDLVDDRLKGKKLKIDLCYRYGLDADDFSLQIGDAEPERFDRRAGVQGKLEHIERTVTAPATLKLRVKNGRPDFCGLVIETDASEEGPGVVLDTLGINGARYATALAWEEASWAAEVKRRPPDLFIFEYGGNEAGDGIVKPEKYRQNALDLIARARRIVPEASCLVIGPSDRVDAEQRIAQVVPIFKQAAEESGCAFWNTYEVMGGKGSLRLWRDTDRAADDGVHLKPKGYTEVGALLLADLMKSF